MARKERDYKAEYRARKERAQRLGVSIPAARGHARPGEITVAEARRAAREGTAARPAAPTPSAKARDYRAEYRARVARLEGQGLSRSAARGHPRMEDVGAAERRQMQRAARIWSPSGWHTEKGRFVRGAYQGPSAERRALAERLAEYAKSSSPTSLSSSERRSVTRIDERKRFVDAFMSLGLGTSNEAYALWFSP